MGVAAPKDPEKKRMGFYIMRNKDIFGSPAQSGGGVQFLYQSDGRIVNSAKLVGGIEDDGMLSMLVKTEDFKKLVYSIGVTVEMEKPEAVDFVFQMYGKTDPYVSGTSIRKTVVADGMENIVKLSEVEWSADDDIIGQIRFEMKEAGRFAKVSVRLYLNDGYSAPEMPEENDIDFGSAEYKRMLEASLVNLGDTKRLEKALCKARAGQDVTIAFIGGSITQGAGAIPINTECYAYKTYKAFCGMFGDGDNIHYIKAGVGGTPSELGMIRYERDVLRNFTVQPDIVVVEFAVNDAGDETNGVCYESLVRKILMSENEPAVVLLFSVFSDDYNLEERLRPVGFNYKLPMVSVKECVVPQFYDAARRIITKNQYFYDCFHPTNAGHKVMADCLGTLFEKVDIKAQKALETVGGDLKEALKAIGDTAFDNESIAPHYGNSFEKVELFDRQNLPTMDIVWNFDMGGFNRIDDELQCVEMDMDIETTPEFPYNWKHDRSGRPMEFDIRCRSLIMINKDSASADAGKAEVFVDGEKVLTADPRKNGWTHCNPLICFSDRERALCHVEVRMAEGDENKDFTILGFGVVR